MLQFSLGGKVSIDLYVKRTYYYYYYYYYIIIIIKLTHSKTILENNVEIESQSVASDFKNLSQYSSRSK